MRRKLPNLQPSLHRMHLLQQNLANWGFGRWPTWVEHSTDAKKDAVEISILCRTNPKSSRTSLVCLYAELPMPEQKSLKHQACKADMVLYLASV